MCSAKSPQVLGDKRTEKEATLQTLKRFWSWASGEVLVSRSWLLLLTLLAVSSLVGKALETWKRIDAGLMPRDDLAILSQHEKVVKALWPNGHRPFAPMPAIAFTHPPDGSLGEHVCTAQGCGMWQVDAEWTCRTEEGRWDAENWRCTRP